MFNNNNQNVNKYQQMFRQKKSSLDQQRGPLFEKVFPPQIISAIKEIVGPLSDIDDRNTRADAIHHVCKKVGLVPGGTGTNRTTVYNPKYPDVIFKIGLDEHGIQNNIDEFELYGDEFLQQFTTKTYECYSEEGYYDGLIATAEKVRVMKEQLHRRQYANRMLEKLEKLYERYVFDDVGLDQFLNWGITPNGQCVILDYAEFEPKENVYATCMECDSDLEYTEGFEEMRCSNPACGVTYRIAEIKNDKRNGGKGNYGGLAGFVPPSKYVE